MHTCGVGVYGHGLPGLQFSCSEPRKPVPVQDRKSTRLNSSHSQISDAVFCLKTKQFSQRMTFCSPRRPRARSLQTLSCFKPLFLFQFVWISSSTFHAIQITSCTLKIYHLTNG